MAEEARIVFTLIANTCRPLPQNQSAIHSKRLTKSRKRRRAISLIFKSSALVFKVQAGLLKVSLRIKSFNLNFKSSARAFGKRGLNLKSSACILKALAEV